MKKNNKALLSALFAILGIAACTKIVSTDIGIGELIPPIDGVTVKDTTLEVIVNTYDTSTTGLGLESINALGIYNDPEFGQTHTEAYVQMLPGSFPFRFAVPKDSIRTIDSVVLVLQTNGLYYGDSTKNLGFRVYEVNDPTFVYNSSAPYFSVNQTFTASTEITYNNNEQFINSLSINDSIKAFGDSTGLNQMRVRLNNAVAQKIINMDTASYRNDTLFKQAFHGIKVASTSGDGLVPVLLSTSRIAIYYKYTNRTDGSDDTTVTYLRPLLGSASSNYIQVNRSGTQLTSLPLGDTATGTEFVYLQSAPGVYARAKVPGLSSFQNRMIYRAELIIDEVPQSTLNKFSPNLFISGFENDRRILLKDATIGQKTNSMGQGINAFYISGLDRFGSTPFVKKDTLNSLNYHQYNFKLTAHVQDVVRGITPNYPLDIFVPFKDSAYSKLLGRYVQIQGGSGGSYYNLNYPVIHRTKIYGNNTNSSHKMRLRIVYSPIQ